VVRVEVDHFFKALENFMKDVESVDTLEAKSTISNWFIQNYKGVLAKVRPPEGEAFLSNHIET
jgi:hypothetical protein